ncbi:DUF2614 family zinc ribbon-containing protein [Aliicoccus persicus]|uniref:Zinc-ribbon containing domain-containing protein n=1 Tax=Aliicoccus persicus TaxID=930138 RepID=A0A662Z554_9STAP|nr:DUF2614 family zinc ribbon-containing protein [Aliicoccus persicus]SEW12776.1 Zinc-ribbon containing domain-containing protein [Aliicoccus persicus]
MKATNKIKRIRGYALIMIFAGMIIMYMGVFFVQIPWLFAIFIILGIIPLILSVVIYFWVGIVSTRTLVVQCPNCEKHTKILGRVDYCIHCNEPLTIDKELEGQVFSRDFNVKHRREKILEEIEQNKKQAED